MNLEVMSYHPLKRVFILAIFLASFCLVTTAQVKSKPLFLPPKILKIDVDSRELALASSPLLKLIDRAGQESPLAFAWQLNADTLIKAKDVFREAIEFDGGATIRQAMAIDTVSLQKSSKPDYEVRRNFYSFSTNLAVYEVSQKKGKQILVLEKANSKDKHYFKVFLDKAAKKILKIQNLSTGRFYLPVPFEGPSISL
ncbi:hypothetical protein HQN84_31055 [Pedobacter steynii]|uniref:hypothetical protein n=1 Tax=Pedobacter steynii TaxID=430522 RepID=UPI00115FF84E|nr:hypothetical protein [Pedobacter steynii]NQX43329.1 hypothetical protein [Pedobacter steynii]